MGYFEFMLSREIVANPIFLLAISLLGITPGCTARQTLHTPELFVAEEPLQARDTEAISAELPEPGHPAYTLSIPDWRDAFRIGSLLSQAPIRRATVVLNHFSATNLQIPTKVKPRRTPWATPWNQENIIEQMNAILLENGIASPNVRVRMIAHAVVASGWRQNVWNFNVWGVRQGSWDGEWYEMPTQEMDENGLFYNVDDAGWRSFSSWRDAIHDFVGRISPDSERSAYRLAWESLHNSSSRPSVDGAYWQALGDANYYTSTKFTPKSFAMLCHQVRTLVRSLSVPDAGPSSNSCNSSVVIAMREPLSHHYWGGSSAFPRISTTRE